MYESKDKLATIWDWLVPNDVHVVRAFLGSVSFYRRSMLGFARIVQPLYDLAKKAQDLLWTGSQHKAFDEIKWACENKIVLKISH